MECSTTQIAEHQDEPSSDLADTGVFYRGLSKDLDTQLLQFGGTTNDGNSSMFQVMSIWKPAAAGIGIGMARTTERL